MVLNSKLTESQDFHLSGLMFVLVATALGLALSLVIFVKDQESRTVREAMAQAATAAVAAPPPPAAPPVPAAAVAPAAAPVAEAPGEASASPAAPSAAGSAAAGGAAFATNCGACHPNGGAGVGPALQGLSEDAIISGTREGVGMMPAFMPDRLSDQQLQDIVAFLRSTN